MNNKVILRALTYIRTPFYEILPTVLRPSRNLSDASINLAIPVARNVVRKLKKPEKEKQFVSLL